MPRNQTDARATTGYEAELWATADSLPGSMDAAERLDAAIAGNPAVRG